MRAPLSRRLPALLTSYALWTVAAIGVWIAVFAFLTLAKYGGDCRGVLHVGSEFRHPAAFSGIPVVGPWGYDGQFYATLATDPLLRSQQTAGFLDNPRYRAQRVFLPMLAYLVGAGNPAAASYAYPILCWLLTAAGFAAFAVLARDFGVPPWWVLAASLNVGVAASLTRSTPDAPAASLLFIAWFLQHRQKALAASAFSVAAALTRETTILGLWALAVADYLKTRRIKAFAAPLMGTGAWFFWTVVLARRFPEHSGGIEGNLGWPLEGLWRKAETLVHGQGLHLMEITAILGLFAPLLAAGKAARPTTDSRGFVFAGYGALALVLTFKVYEEAFAFARVLLPLAWAGALSVEPGARRAFLKGGVALQALAGLSLVHGEFLAAGGVRHVLGKSVRALALWFFPR